MAHGSTGNMTVPADDSTSRLQVVLQVVSGLLPVPTRACFLASNTFLFGPLAYNRPAQQSSSTEQLNRVAQQSSSTNGTQADGSSHTQHSIGSWQQQHTAQHNDGSWQQHSPSLSTLARVSATLPSGISCCSPRMQTFALGRHPPQVQAAIPLASSRSMPVAPLAMAAAARTPQEEVVPLGEVAS